jgi:hypothetical protein
MFKSKPNAVNALPESSRTLLVLRTVTLVELAHSTMIWVIRHVIFAPQERVKVLLARPLVLIALLVVTLRSTV